MRENNDLAPSVNDRPDQETAPDVEITLVVPVYEEEENIVPFVQEVKAVVRLPHQIVIVYDHDTDSTLNRRDEVLAIDPRIVFVRNTGGSGVINAFRTGFDAAKTRYIVPIMADLSDTPETIGLMHAKMLEGYDLVVGSRYCAGGRKVGGPYIKYLLSLIANLSLQKITNLPTHDMTNAFIMYKKEVLDNIHIRSSGGFEVTMELIAKAFILGYRITEVPTVNRNRAAGKSNFQLFKWIRNYLYWYFYILIYSIVRRLNAHYLRDTKKLPTR
jgi:glycosyltransferase involved in cell wall biosynthesis